MIDPTGGALRPFLVVQGDPFVALDIEDTIVTHFGNAVVRCVQDCASAVAQIATGLSPAVVVVDAREHLITSSGLATAVAGCGGGLVVIGESEMDRPAGWGIFRSLDKPFTADGLVAALSDVRAQLSDSPSDGSGPADRPA